MEPAEGNEPIQSGVPFGSTNSNTDHQTAATDIADDGDFFLKGFHSVDDYFAFCDHFREEFRLRDTVITTVPAAIAN